MNLPQIYEGYQVHLRAVGREDARVFYDWRSDLASFNLLPEAGLNSFEEYLPHWEQMIARTITLLVVRATDGHPIGFVQAYDVSPQEGWCFVLSYQTPETRGQRMGLEAATAFWDYLFAQLNMRKLYMDVAEFNLGWLRAFPGVEVGAFAEEGRFRQHVWHDGRYWDTVRLAIYGDKWLQLRDWIFWLMTLGNPPRDVVARDGAAPVAPDDDQAPQPFPSHGPASPSLTPRLGTAPSPARLAMVKKFLRCDREQTSGGDLMDLLAEDFLFTGAMTMIKGVTKRDLESNLQFRYRMRRLVSGRAAQLRPIAWQPPEEAGDTLRVRGLGRSGSIVLAWTFDVSGKICRHTYEGPPDLVASYLLGDVPPD